MKPRKETGFLVSSFGKGNPVSWLALCVWIAGTWIVTGPGLRAAAAGQHAPTTWDGVYTADQAARGQEQYDVFCANCHGVDMQGQGVDVPSLVDERFRRKWDGRTVKALYDLVRRSMPENQPGSLKKESYDDLLAYILQQNGFPAGATELRGDADGVDRIAIQPDAPR